MEQIDTQFFLGNMRACYELAKDQEKSEDAMRYIELFEKHDFALLPQYVLKSGPQSIEGEDERYPEDVDVYKIRMISDEELFQAQIKELELIARTGADHEKAQSFYTQGYLFLYAHHYEESIYSFSQAAKLVPEKAVYSGILAQTMQRLSYSPFEVLAYLQQAIELDSDNARWHWVKALTLMELYKNLSSEGFLESTIDALTNATEKCRPTQISLKSAIDSTHKSLGELLQG